MHLPFLVKVKKILSYPSSSGLTLIEMLAVILAVGMLAALAIPNWLAFVDTRRLNTAKSEAYYAIHQAHSQAKKEKLTWQASFREQNGIVQWVVHQAEAGKFIPDTVNNNDSLWHSLEPNISIDQEQNNKGKLETTFPKHPSQSMWRVLFNYHGCPIYTVGDECTNTSLRTLGQITFYSQNGSKSKRCVYVSTVLGALKTGKNQVRANDNDKYCY
ncbi:hypothetical protein NIES4074_42170 [Cylindrospermum sp. NIES-4074]|nr:hypothetical protein NIES4074_42170 [Cylindrospermum sp. NIES-4074]